MEILPVGAELFHAYERTDGQTQTNRHDEANSSLFAILRTQLKIVR